MRRIKETSENMTKAKADEMVMRYIFTHVRLLKTTFCRLQEQKEEAQRMLDRVRDRLGLNRKSIMAVENTQNGQINEINSVEVHLHLDDNDEDVEVCD